MRVFDTPEYSRESLTRFFEGQTRTEGVIKRKKLETLERVRIVLRPFREVMWKLESPTGVEEKTSVSYIDEQLSSYISDPNHRLLLWRPRYAGLRIDESDEVDFEIIESTNTKAVERVIDDLIQQRLRGQELDEELRPKLRSLQADPLSAIALIVPRTPYSIQGEKQILEERKESHSFVMASSLVTNCSPKDIMTAVGMGESVYVKTIIAEYRDVSTDGIRILVIETPGSGSLQDARRSGQALNRICDLYPECTELLL